VSHQPFNPPFSLASVRGPVEMEVVFEPVVGEGFWRGELPGAAFSGAQLLRTSGEYAHRPPVAGAGGPGRWYLRLTCRSPSFPGK
jgi:hypothetical protein